MTQNLQLSYGELPATGTRLWTVSAMTSENKNGRYSWGTLYGRPLESLAFHYGRHKEATRYVLKRYRYYHTTVMYVFCLPLTNFGWFRFPDAIDYNLMPKICFTR